MRVSLDLDESGEGPAIIEIRHRGTAIGAFVRTGGEWRPASADQLGALDGMVRVWAQLDEEHRREFARRIGVKLKKKG